MHILLQDKRPIEQLPGEISVPHLFEFMYLLLQDQHLIKQMEAVFVNGNYLTFAGQMTFCSLSIKLPSHNLGIFQKRPKSH